MYSSTTAYYFVENKKQPCFTAPSNPEKPETTTRTPIEQQTCIACHLPAQQEGGIRDMPRRFALLLRREPRSTQQVLRRQATTTSTFLPSRVFFLLNDKTHLKHRRRAGTTVCTRVHCKKTRTLKTHTDTHALKHSHTHARSCTSCRVLPVRT